MNFFEVRDGELHCEDVPLARIAEAVGTPVYVYSTATLERHYNVFQTAFAHRRALVAFAVKANSNLSVLRVLARLGAGADTVSEGEIRRALAAGMPPQRIVFSGMGKTAHELAFAIEAGVSEINVESEPELDLLVKIAEGLGARPAVTIRVNPDIAAGGHDKIATGKSDNKFGVSFSEAERLYAKAYASRSLNPIGVACHIGSQITDLRPMRAAFAKMRGLVQTLRAQGGAEMHLGHFRQAVHTPFGENLFGRLVHRAGRTFRQRGFKLLFQFRQAFHKLVPGQNGGGRHRQVLLGFVPLHQFQGASAAHQRLFHHILARADRHQRPPAGPRVV